MPWTPSHMAAVLPLLPACPRWLSAPALMVGAMSPDFGYYVGWFGASTLAHTGRGLLLVCLPSSALVLWALHLSRQHLCFLLPQPHRRAIESEAFGITFQSRRVPIIVVSVLIGALTHLLWDSFTHPNRLGTMLFPALSRDATLFAGVTIPWFRLLQHASTVIGSSLLLWAYFRWLRRQLGVDRTLSVEDRQHNAVRYRWIYTCGIAALCMGSVVAVNLSRLADGSLSLRIFAFRATVISSSIFVLCLGLIAWRKAPRSRSSP